jgi:hypothetical protein
MDLGSVFIGKCIAHEREALQNHVPHIYRGSTPLSKANTLAAPKPPSINP